MRKKREFVEGAFYHVTSRTNNKIRVFSNNLGRKIMLIILQDAKNKFRFRLANFCIMPTHIHLLIKPEEGTNLSAIMQWIKTRSASLWNKIHGSTDHLWGHRFFARAINDFSEFDYILQYIDQNPVVAGLCATAQEWKASGAFYRAQNISGLVDFSLTGPKAAIKLLSPIPPLVSRLLPPAQLSRVTQYFGGYADDIERLYKIVPDIPKISDTAYTHNPPVYLHYFTGTADYFICEYDGEDVMFGKAKFAPLPLGTSLDIPSEAQYQRFSLNRLKSNQLMNLDLSWKRPYLSTVK